MPHRIRVLFVIGTMGGGGAERQVIEILRLIDRSRFEPVLYLATREGDLLSNVPNDVPVFAFRKHSNMSWWRKVVRFFKLTPLLRYLHLAIVLRRERIDVVYDRTYLATLDAAGATWLRSTPRISCCVVDPQPELELHAQGRRALVWRIARSAYRRANLVMANSEGLRERVIEYFCLTPDRVITCRNLIDLEQFDHRACEDVHFAPAEPFLIVAAGRLHVQKGYRYLLEAVNDLVNRRGRKLRLIVLGAGELESEFRKYVQSHQLEEQVTFAGFVANPLPWYRRAHLFVLSSLYEGLPNSLLEAAACGTPVVSTECPSGPAEILEGGRLGTLVPPADSPALVNAIEDAMDHYPEWQHRAMMARDSVRRRYDARIGIQELQESIELVWRHR